MDFNVYSNELVNKMSMSIRKQIRNYVFDAVMLFAEKISNCNKGFYYKNYLKESEVFKEKLAINNSKIKKRGHHFSNNHNHNNNIFTTVPSIKLAKKQPTDRASNKAVEEEMSELRELKDTPLFLFESAFEKSIPPYSKFKGTIKESKVHKPKFLKNHVKKLSTNNVSNQIIYNDFNNIIIHKKLIENAHDFDKIVVLKSLINNTEQNS